MELVFEHVQEVGVGNYPDLIHLWDNEANLMYIQDGRMRSKYTKTPDGEWDDREFIGDIDISADDNITSWRIDTLGGFGAIGAYRTGDIHKLVIYEYQFDLSEYLNNGSIKHSNDPVSSFTLALENPDIKDPERPGNVAVNEENSLLSPGAKIIFKFSAGDNEEYELGTFYIDRSNFTLLSEVASVDGRNLIGKALKDQTLDENAEYWFTYISNIITGILLAANLNKEQFLVENTSQQNWFNFGPTATPFKAIEDIRSLMIDWKIEELTDGTIVVGSPNYSGFASRGTYSFYRNKDIFSRQIVRDDAEVYNRVCVHTEGFGIAVFRDIETYEGWNLQGNKTMYVQVANNTRLSQVEAYADELASQIANVGKIESFTGPIRPQLMAGDEAVINNENGSKSLGLITEITHNFGKSGFYTHFTVDSGGKLGKGRLSDFIKKIAVGSAGGQTTIGYSDIPIDEYRDLGPEGKVSVSSTYNEKSTAADYIMDGRLGTRWVSADDDEYPFVIWDYGRRCRIDKMSIYLDREDYEGMMNYQSYRVDYWNGAFWVELFTIPAGIIHLIEHNLDTPIETSRLRLTRMTSESRARIHQWEIHGWG